MTPRAILRPSRRTLVLSVFAAATLGAAGCGGDAGDGRTVETSPPTTEEPVAKAQRLDTGDTKEAAGTVSVCGPLVQMRLLQPAVRRFDDVSERLQASTLGFPDGQGRALRAFQERQRTESRDCDVYLAAGVAEVPVLAADGGLYDLAPAVKGWTAAEGDPGLAPVRAGERVFGLPLRSAPASGVLVLSVHGRNPGGGLELLRALADARVSDD